MSILKLDRAVGWICIRGILWVAVNRHDLPFRKTAMTIYSNTHEFPPQARNKF